LDALDRAGRQTRRRVNDSEQRWAMEQVAQIAARTLAQVVADAGLTEDEARSAALRGVVRSDQAARAGTIRFPQAHRWVSAKNGVRNAARDERRHHERRDERFFERNGLERDDDGVRRVNGVWKSQAFEEQ